jgi:hypothetical protein
MGPKLVAQRSAGSAVGDEALRAIGLLFEPDDIIEIRALNVGRTPERPGYISSGYFNFDQGPAIANAVQQLDGKAIIRRYTSACKATRVRTVASVQV